MAIEDFEWERQGEQPESARVRQARSLTRREGWLSRLRKSVWLEPVVKLSGMAALLAVLAGIGVVATTYAKPGLPLPERSRGLVDALGASWLKPTPAAPRDDPHPQRSGVPLAQLPLMTATVAAPASPAPVPPTSETQGATASAPASGLTADGRVILNLASAEELTKLPGVGKRRAEAIVALRTKLKRFKQPTDLLRVKGVGPRGLKRMLPHLVLDSP